MILFLGIYKDNNILNWLKQQGENLIYEDNPINLQYIQSINPDFVISYNYKSIIEKKLLILFKKEKSKRLIYIFLIFLIIEDIIPMFGVF